MKDQFSTKDLSKILGRTTQSIDDWVNRGLIVPDIQEASGTGSKRLYSREAVHKAVLVYTLTEKLKMARQPILHILSVCQGDFNWANNTLKVYWDYDGPEDQPYAINFVTGFDPTEKHDIEIYIDLAGVALWTGKRILEVIL
jgi:DNA-binding transcriptional MerR regulator